MNKMNKDGVWFVRSFAYADFVCPGCFVDFREMLFFTFLPLMMNFPEICLVCSFVDYWIINDQGHRWKVL
jgi:hypothetical protein